MKIGLYTGSFNPWHKGHDDILDKALQVFDEVIIAQGINPDKKISETKAPSVFRNGKKIKTVKFKGLLVNFIDTNKNLGINAIVRGLRNGKDLDYETTQQYWNEDLGLTIPTVYFVTDRSLVHISSSALRALKKIK